ncbi:hypothetical protein B7P43_G07942 [Cryptotermes secundus]|nr:uncharacterized protein LOC111865466 isoform X3 [Cryptotermes secundus]PNF31925.1 hypothetical protein B7P43_G07942 [Cryptotermes secundus]
MQAEDRGREATVKLRQEQAHAEHERDASKKRQKFVRNVEDLRSIVVASLEKKTPKQASRKDMDTSDTSAEGIHSDDSPSTASTTSSISTEAAQPRVWVYDHGSRFESQHPIQARVERMFPCAHEPDATEAAQLESQMFQSSKLLSDDEATSRLRARGQQALIKEHLHQDYRQLLGDLRTLAREERLIRSTQAHRLPAEMFLEDYRREELCTRRQKNMDSAFENVYHTVQQGYFSCPSSVAGTGGSQHWEVAELNVAEWQPLKQKSASPINSINVAASSGDSHPAAIGIVHSKGRTSTSEDSVERVNIQQPLLEDEMNVDITAPQEAFHTGGSVPVGSTDQFPVGRSLNVRWSSLHEDELKCGKERKDAIDHEEEAVLHKEEVKQKAEEFEGDEVRDEQVSLVEMPSALSRNSTDDKVQEDEMSQLSVALGMKKCGKHRRHRASREGDKITKTCDKGCRKHGKGRTVESQKMASDVDKCDRSDAEMVRESDAAAVCSEYRLNVSVCKTREQSAESVTGSSTSASYERLKVVVSQSESTDEKHQLATSPEKVEIFPCRVSLQKIERSDIVRGNICKQKHIPHDGDNRSVKEKGIAMRGNIPEAVEIDVMLQKGESDRQKDRTKKGNVPLDKDFSEASTAYISPPDQSDSSDIHGLGKQIETVHKYEERCPDACGTNSSLAVYISRLLVMSRESVENLDVSMSDTSAPDVETSGAEEIDRNVHHEMTVGSAKRKETMQKQMHTNLRSGIDAVEELTHTMKEEMRYMTDDVRMPRLERETVSHSRQAVCITSVSQVAGANSYNAFRHSATEIQSTSTLGMLPTSHKIMSRDLHDRMSRLEGTGRKDVSMQEQLHSSCRCSDSLCEFNVKTPPFPSFISDMSLDEYKVLKFPQIFSGYSEKCSERISNLTKKIEQIRGKKWKLIECSGSRSSNNASSNGFDSTKYLRSPESSSVMTHLSSKDKGHISTEVTDRKSGAPTWVPNADSRQQVSQNEGSAEGVASIKPVGGGGTGEQQQQRCHRPHVRPPPCLWRHKLQSAVDTRPVKELSTITEAESTQSVYSCNTKHPKSVAEEKSESGEDSEVWVDDDIPDVMMEMLRRGLITSPLAWTKMAEQSDHETSEVSASRSGDSDGSGPSSHDTESRNSTASVPQHAEHEKFKQAVLESYVGKGTGTAESFRDRESIADKKIGFSQQVAETFAKLGKNPSRTDVNNAFKNLGLKWKARGRDQPVNPIISKEDLDPASEEFRQQVLESFVGLGLDSSPEDLEAAFRRLGLDCPGASLCKSDVTESTQTCRASVTPESSGTTPNSSDTNDPSISTSSNMLSPALPSDSVSSDDDLLA